MAATKDQRDEFGRKLRALRESRRLTQPALGELLADHGGENVSAPAISDWERGVSAPSQDNAAALERIFDEPLADLLGYRGTGLLADRVAELEAMVKAMQQDDATQRALLDQILRLLGDRGSAE